MCACVRRLAFWEKLKGKHTISCSFPELIMFLPFLPVTPALLIPEVCLFSMGWVAQVHLRMKWQSKQWMHLLLTSSVFTSGFTGVCNAQIHQPKPVLIPAFPPAGESTFPPCKERWDSVIRFRSVSPFLVVEVEIRYSCSEGIIGGLCIGFWSNGWVQSLSFFFWY